MYQAMMVEIGDVKKRRGPKSQGLYNTNFNEQCWKTQWFKELLYNTQYRLSGQALPWPERVLCVEP